MVMEKTFCMLQLVSTFISFEKLRFDKFTSMVQVMLSSATSVPVYGKLKVKCKQDCSPALLSPKTCENFHSRTWEACLFSGMVCLDWCYWGHCSLRFDKFYKYGASYAQPSNKCFCLW